MSDDRRELFGFSQLAPFRYTAFRFYTANRVLASLGNTLLQAIMAWQVYEISGSALSLGLLGFVRFFPALIMSLVGGAVADTRNRKQVVLVAQLVPITVSIILATATFSHAASLGLIYGLVLLLACSSSFEGPARESMMPALIPVGLLPSAVTVGWTIRTIGSASGPVLAGFIIGTGGIAVAYTFHFSTLALAMILLFLVHYEPIPIPSRRFSMAMVREGVSFVVKSQPLLGSNLLDLFAVIFGGATALLPIYANDILHVGPKGFGLLAAATDFGAMLMSVILISRPPIQRTGRVLLMTVACFGFAAIVFGLSRSFALSLAAYACMGASDQISVVLRGIIAQVSTPDALRGRVNAVSQVFFGSANQLGAIESGVVAQLTNATFAVVSGGIGTIAVVAVIAARMPVLRAYRAPTGQALAEEALAEEAAAAAKG